VFKDQIWRFKSRFGRLYALLAAPRGGVCAEVGVWQGAFSARLVQLRAPRELHLIDPWHFEASLPERMYGGSEAKSQDDMDAIMASVVDRFSGNACVNIHRGKSADLVKLFPDAHFDWVYIDGDHSYDAVLSDLNAWFSKVKPGGRIVCDDYVWVDEARVQSVKAAIETFLKAHPGLKTRLVLGQFLIKTTRAEN